MVAIIRGTITTLAMYNTVKKASKPIKTSGAFTLMGILISLLVSGCIIYFSYGKCVEQVSL